jgi:hypothetical protein
MYELADATTDRTVNHDDLGLTRDQYEVLLRLALQGQGFAKVNGRRVYVWEVFQRVPSVRPASK